jgi:SAM-dependent methyltransferase
MREYFARILISEVEEFTILNNKKVLDVGGSRGEFCQVLNKERACNAINLDPNPGKYIWEKTIVGRAEKIPFKNNEFDLVINRGVLEHIPTENHQLCINEMYRVTKKNGICYMLVPMWFNFHAGHSLKPFHLFPFKIAKFLRQLIFRNKITGNSFEEENLYKTTYKGTSTLIKNSRFKILSTKDAHFRLHFLTRIPLLREFSVPAVAFILKK